MTSKLLQWLGVAFVLALCAAAAFALAVVKDRVRVVVEADATAAGPEPIALLRDDLGVLARDVAELRSALGQNLERLGEALEQRATARHGDVEALVRDVAALRERLAAQTSALRELEQVLAARGTGTVGDGTPVAPRPVATAAGAADSGAVDSGSGDSGTGDSGTGGSGTVDSGTVDSGTVDSGTVDSGTGDSGAVDSGAGQSGTTASATTEPQPAADGAASAAATAAGATTTAPKPKAQGFLSFSLPASTFAFDAEQTWRIVPELSRVGFDAKSTLHDFTGVTSKVSGSLTANLAAPEGDWRGAVVCEAATLVTGVEGRDDNMREHLDTEHHPRIEFTIERFVPAADGVDVGKQTARGEVQGRMTIRGKTRELRMPITVAVDQSRRLVVDGQVKLKLSDYDVPVPSQLGVINMEDEVAVWIALRARLVAEGGK